MDDDSLRAQARRLLLQWQAGHVTEADVVVRAESLAARTHGAETLPEADLRSIAQEVLRQLEMLPTQGITTDDVPAVLAFLETRAGREADGWAAWRAYWQSVDFQDRRRSLAGHPFYTAG